MTRVQRNFRANYPGNWKAPVARQKPGIVNRFRNWLNLEPSLITPDGISMRPTDLNLNNVSTMLSSSVTFLPGSREGRETNPERVLEYLGDLTLNEDGYLTFNWLGSQQVDITLQDGYGDELLGEEVDILNGEEAEFSLNYGTRRFGLIVTNADDDVEIGQIVFDVQDGQLRIAIVSGFEAEQVSPGAVGDKKALVSSLFEDLTGYPEVIEFTWQGLGDAGFCLLDQHGEDLGDISYYSNGEEVAIDNFYAEEDLSYNTLYTLVVIDPDSQKPLGNFTFHFDKSHTIYIQKVEGLDNMETINPETRLLTLFEGLRIDSRRISFEWKGRPDLFYAITYRHPSNIVDGGELFCDEYYEIDFRREYVPDASYSFRVAEHEGRNFVGSFVFTAHPDGTLDIRDINGFDSATLEEASAAPVQLQPLGSFSHNDVRVKEARGEEVEIEWDAVEGANAYEVRHGDWLWGLKNARPVVVTDLGHTFTGLQSRTTYYYNITPVRTDSDTEEIVERGEQLPKEFNSGNVTVPQVGILSQEAKTTSATVRVALPEGVQTCIWRVFYDQDDADESNPREGWPRPIQTGRADRTGECEIWGLEPNRTYWLALHSEHTTGVYSRPHVLEIRTEAINLAEVEKLSADRIHAGSAFLAWNPVPDATDYEVVFWRGETMLNLQNEETTIPNISLQSLQPDTQYNARVRAFYKKGTMGEQWGAWTGPVPFTTKPLEAPSNVSAENVKTGAKHASATLSWKAVSGVTRYEVRRADTETNLLSADPIDFITETTSGKVTHALRNLTPNQTIWVQVRAYVGDYHGDWSDPISFTTLMTQRQATQAARGSRGPDPEKARMEEAKRARAAKVAADKAASAARKAEEAARKQAASEERQKEKRMDFAKQAAELAFNTQGYTKVGKMEAAARTTLDRLLKDKPKPSGYTARAEATTIIREMIEEKELNKKQVGKLARRLKDLNLNLV